MAHVQDVQIVGPCPSTDFANPESFIELASEIARGRAYLRVQAGHKATEHPQCDSHELFESRTTPSYSSFLFRISRYVDGFGHCVIEGQGHW